jgi:hypothetical protein
MNTAENQSKLLDSGDTCDENTYKTYKKKNH